jgi:hypothetical protein
MPTIEERWNGLPILERIKIARAAGLAGKVGSASWEGIHEMDRETLTAWSKPDRETKIQDQVWKDAGIEVKGGEFISEPQEEIALPTNEQIESYEKQKQWDKGEDRKRSSEAQDYLLWVGYASYPTIRSFIDEDKRLGACRRVSRVPRDLELEESRIFLAHDEGETEDAVIFGYFYVSAIEVITYRDGNNGIPEELRGVAVGVTLEQAAEEEERSCGYREDLGAIYLRGGLIVLEPYRSYEGPRFRGIKKVDGDKILKGKAKSAPSERHKIRRSDRIECEPGSRWSEKEQAKLKELIKELGTWRGCREMRKLNGRSIYSASYQWSKMKKEAQDD